MSPPPPEAVPLALTGVSCVRGGRLLFEDLSLTLARGEAMVVTGPNGVGKSSLLRVCAGLLRPTSGRVDAGRVALADDALALEPRRTLGAALSYWAALDGGDANAGITAFALEDVAEVPVRMLSTGQRRRAGLARAIAARAQLWLLDEPANGLDAANLDRLAAAVTAHLAADGAVLAAAHGRLPFDTVRTLELAG